MEDLDLHAKLVRVAADAFVVFGQRHRPECFDLHLAAHVHAGAVDDQNFWHCDFLVGCAAGIIVLDLALAAASENSRISFVPLRKAAHAESA